MSKPATEARSVVAKRASRKSAKVAKKSAAKRLVAKAAKPRKTNDIQGTGERQQP